MYKDAKVRGHIPIRTCPLGTWPQQCVRSKRETEFGGHGARDHPWKILPVTRNVNCRERVWSLSPSGQYGSSLLCGIHCNSIVMAFIVLAQLGWDHFSQNFILYRKISPRQWFPPGESASGERCEWQLASPGWESGSASWRKGCGWI